MYAIFASSNLHRARLFVIALSSLDNRRRRSPMATNQEYSIYKQLKEVGVRGLMLDIQRDANGVLILVHGLVQYSRLIDVIRYEIEPFLDEDPRAIVTIDLETLGDRAMLMHDRRPMGQPHGVADDQRDEGRRPTRAGHERQRSLAV